MVWVWKRLIWRRKSHLQVELPPHGPSLATLIKVMAKSDVLIADIDVERLSSFMAFEPGVFTYKPALVAIVVRTRGRRHEEQFLHLLTGPGYTCDRTSAPVGDRY